MEAPIPKVKGLAAAGRIVSFAQGLPGSVRRPPSTAFWNGSAAARAPATATISAARACASFSRRPAEPWLPGLARPPLPDAGANQAVYILSVLAIRRRSDPLRPYYFNNLMASTARLETRAVDAGLTGRSIKAIRRAVGRRTRAASSFREQSGRRHPPGHWKFSGSSRGRPQLVADVAYRISPGTARMFRR